MFSNVLLLLLLLNDIICRLWLDEQFQMIVVNYGIYTKAGT